MLDCIHVCVFHSRKIGFKKWLDTSWHLAVCWDSSVVSYRFPDSSSILGGLIEKALASSIASRHLVDRLTFCSWICWVVPRYLSCRRPFPRYLHLTSFTEGLYIPSSRSNSHFFNLSTLVHLPNTLSLTPNLFLYDFSNFFKIILLLVSF